MFPLGASNLASYPPHALRSESLGHSRNVVKIMAVASRSVGEQDALYRVLNSIVNCCFYSSPAVSWSVEPRFFIMSQFTVQFILSLIWLIISLLEKGARLVNTIIDIVDDGIINDSFEKPIWYQKLCTILVSLQDKRTEVESLVDEVRSSQKP